MVLLMFDEVVHEGDNCRASYTGADESGGGAWEDVSSGSCYRCWLLRTNTREEGTGGDDIIHGRMLMISLDCDCEVREINFW